MTPPLRAAEAAALRAAQRAAWKRALAAAAAVRRNQRYRPAAPAIRSGMVRLMRQDDANPPADDTLSRACSAKSEVTILWRAR